MFSRSHVSTALVAGSLVLGTIFACSDASETPKPSAPASFCDALSTAYARCGGATSCGTAMSADCAKLASLLAPSVLEGATSCVKSTDCGSDPLACLGKALGGATPSAAQTKLGTDYCSSCSVVGGDACNTAFIGTADVPGLGFALLPFGDALMTEIDTECTTSSLGKTACQGAFSTCLTATTTKFLANSVSTTSAKCLIEGIKAGLEPAAPGGSGGGSDGGAGADSATPPAPCGPENCAGCCEADDACRTTASDTACGRAGNACAPCAGAKICERGRCIDSTCKASCASGCCSETGCQGGSTTDACGTGGNACSACGPGQTCAAGVCSVDAGALFDFVAVGATIPALNQSGGSWDAFSGLPDPLLKATSGAAAGETTYAPDTLSPQWNKVVLSGLSASALQANLKIELFDSDTAFDDVIGGCAVTLTGAEFDGALYTASCPASATGVALTVSYRLKAH